MMYSNRSEYGHRRQHSDRDSRPWENYDDKGEEKRESQRDIRRDSYDKYGGDGHSRTQRISRSSEYSDSPKKPYSKDLKRNSSRKSSVRRGMSSTDWSVPEKKRRMLTEKEDDLYRFKQEPEDEPYRQSPDKFSHKHRAKDYKHTPQEEEFRYRKTPQESRYSLRHEEFPSKQQPDDSTYRHTPGYYTDRDGGERSQDHSQERAQSQDHSIKTSSYTEQYFGQPGQRSDSFSTDYENHLQIRTRVPLNSSSGQTCEDNVIRKIGKSLLPEPKKSAKGFQRFLDVLNKGVNFDVLTKIVNQNHTEADDRTRSPSSFQSAEDRPWSPPGSTWRQQGGHQNTECWNEIDESVRCVSPRPHHRSFRCDASDEKSTQTRNEGRSYFSLDSRCLSPLMLQKTTLTPEDEHKRRQMQDVLQAIGMNFGFDELGQMSHRIQERLYGKKDSDRDQDCEESSEMKGSQAFSPRRRSRSSSSKCSFSPVSQNYYRKSDSHSVPREETKPDQDVEYSHQSSGSVQDSEKSQTYSKENSGAYQTFNPNPSHTVSEPPPMLASTAVSYTPLQYTALSPNGPPIGPQFFMPQLPPFLRYPPIPPVNLFPAVLAQTRQLVYPHISNHPPSLHLPELQPPQPLSTSQKSKPLTRPRCLQVIETKQPG